MIAQAKQLFIRLHVALRRNPYAYPQRCKAAGQLWPLAGRSAGRVGEDMLTACLFQGGCLQVRFLVVGRDPRIAVFHGRILRQNS